MGGTAATDSLGLLWSSIASFFPFRYPADSLLTAYLKVIGTDCLADKFAFTFQVLLQCSATLQKSNFGSKISFLLFMVNAVW